MARAESKSARWAIMAEIVANLPNISERETCPCCQGEELHFDAQITYSEYFEDYTLTEVSEEGAYCAVCRDFVDNLLIGE